MKSLSFNLVEVKHPQYPPPKNWFIFGSDGKMAGPGTRSVMEQELGLLEEKDLAEKRRSWVFGTRQIPEKFRAEFRKEFGFHLPDEDEIKPR